MRHVRAYLTITASLPPCQVELRMHGEVVTALTEKEIAAIGARQGAAQARSSAKPRGPCFETAAESQQGGTQP